MHRCWSIDEILQRVLACVDGGANRGCTLAALATSCKILHEPTMNHLWATLDSIAPLVKCMPRDVWYFEPDLTYGPGYYSSRGALNLSRAPTKDEWNAFAKHAHRVRRISMAMSTACIYIGFDVIFALNDYLVDSSLLGASPLFPNLEDLTINYFMTLGRGLIGIWKCFSALSTGGRLLKVSLTGSPVTSFTDESVQAMSDIGFGLLEMVARNSGLQVFVCRSNGSDWLQADTTILSNMFGATPFSKLRYLDLEFISLPASTITLLASFQHLSTLIIKIHESAAVGLPPLPFSALTSLALRSWHLHCGVSLIGIITSSRLTCLTLRSGPWMSMAEARNLFSAVAQHRTLSSLVIHLNDSFEDASPLRQITEFQTEYGLVDVLEPILLALTKLKEFSLRGMIRLDLDQTQMLCLAKAWPNIEQLILEPHQTSGLGSMDIGPRQVPINLLPFTTLAMIAAHFPRLCSLCLVMDHTLASPAPREIHSNTNMRDLRIAVDTIKHLDVKEVAQYVRALYPQIETCRFDITDDDDNKYGWNAELETILGSEAAEDKED